jgi:hypothetical protein
MQDELLGETRGQSARELVGTTRTLTLEARPSNPTRCLRPSFMSTSVGQPLNVKRGLQGSAWHGQKQIDNISQRKVIGDSKDG